MTKKTETNGDKSESKAADDHMAQLMRINAQMFDGTIRVLGQQVAELTAENAALRKDRDSKGTSAELDKRKHLLAQVAGNIAPGVLSDPGPASSHADMAEIAVSLAEAILQKVGL